MNDSTPLGFIVEGHCEYNCYPSIVCRIVESHGFAIPIVNAGGCGNIVKNIKEQLTDLLLASNPLTVIITVDLHDVISQGLATNCIDLIHKINSQVIEWRNSALSDHRLLPLPTHIMCIVQVRSFDSWLMTDIESLKDAGLIKPDTGHIAIPEDITNPCEWFEANLVHSEYIKSPAVAKKITSELDPEIMRTHSRSFDKFYREIKMHYQNWLALIS